jgi:uncharacterized coiled-coil protein SlyX
VARNVEPLKAKVKEMEKSQAKTEAELAMLNDMLGKLKVIKIAHMSEKTASQLNVLPSSSGVAFTLNQNRSVDPLTLTPAPDPHKVELDGLNSNFKAANGELSELQSTAARMEKVLSALYFS